MIQGLRDTRQAHEDAYAELLASKDELKDWLIKDDDYSDYRMPLVGECHQVARIAYIDEVSRTQLPLERMSSTPICGERTAMV